MEKKHPKMTKVTRVKLPYKLRKRSGEEIPGNNLKELRTEKDIEIIWKVIIKSETKFFVAFFIKEYSE